MTPQRTKQLLESGVLQAFADRKPVQWKTELSNGWRDVDYSLCPCNFNFDCDGVESRVTPPEKTLEELCMDLANEYLPEDYLKQLTPMRRIELKLRRDAIAKRLYQDLHPTP